MLYQMKQPRTVLESATPEDSETVLGWFILPTNGWDVNSERESFHFRSFNLVLEATVSILLKMYYTKTYPYILNVDIVGYFSIFSLFFLGITVCGHESIIIVIILNLYKLSRERLAILWRNKRKEKFVTCQKLWKG